MNFEFLSKCDFLGILPCLVSLKKMQIDNVHDVNYTDYLLNIRKFRAKIEAYFLNDEIKIELEHNADPWSLLHDKVAINRIPGKLAERIFEDITDDESKSVYFKKYKSNPSFKKYEVEKQQLVDEYKYKLNGELTEILTYPKKTNNYFFNICFNPSSTSSLWLRERLEKTIKLSDLIIGKNILNFSRITHKEVDISENKILVIIPFVGIMVKKLRMDDNEIPDKFDAEGKISYQPSVIYLSCHFRGMGGASLSDLSVLLDRDIIKFLKNDQELTQTLNEFAKFESNDPIFYLNKFMSRNMRSPKDVGVVFFISFKRNVLEKVMCKNFDNYFYDYIKNSDIKKWETRFECDEISNFRL